MSGGERLGLLHRSLGQDGVDALRVRQLQVSPPGRQVVILLLLLFLPPAVPRMSRMSTRPLLGGMSFTRFFGVFVASIKKRGNDPMKVSDRNLGLTGNLYNL